MVYRGRMRGGVVVLEGLPGMLFPDGTCVVVEVIPEMATGMTADVGNGEEQNDRLLGVLRETSPEGMHAQQRIDRVL